MSARSVLCSTRQKRFVQWASAAPTCRVMSARMVALILAAVITIAAERANAEMGVTRFPLLAYQNAKTDRMVDFGVVKIGIVNVSPRQSDSFLCDQIYRVVATDINRPHKKESVSRNIAGHNVEFVVGLSEIKIIWGRIEIVRRNPTAIFRGACSSDILKICRDIDFWFPVFVVDDKDGPSARTYNGAQLFTGVGLRIGSGLPLLVDEEISHAANYEKEGREHPDDLSPRHDVAVFLCLAGLLVSTWLSWTTIHHFVFSPRRRPLWIYAAQFIAAYGLIWASLALVFGQP